MSKNHFSQKIEQVHSGPICMGDVIDSLEKGETTSPVIEYKTANTHSLHHHN